MAKQMLSLPMGPHFAGTADYCNFSIQVESVMQTQKSNRNSFGCLLSCQWLLAGGVAERWWWDGLSSEATGSLVNFHCGNGLRIDAPVRIGGGRGSLDIGNDVLVGIGHKS
jgi:hypothetical protein